MIILVLSVWALRWIHQTTTNHTLMAETEEADNAEKKQRLCWKKQRLDFKYLNVGVALSREVGGMAIAWSRTVSVASPRFKVLYCPFGAVVLFLGSFATVNLLFLTGFEVESLFLFNSEPFISIVRDLLLCHYSVDSYRYSYCGCGL